MLDAFIAKKELNLRGNPFYRKKLNFNRLLCNKGMFANGFSRASPTNNNSIVVSIGL